MTLFLGLGTPSPGRAEAAATSSTAQGDSAKSPKSKAAVDSDALDSLLSMADKDPGKLSETAVQPQSESTSAGASTPSDTLSSSNTDFSKSTSTGDLLKELPNVSGRRLSGINIDPRVRGYHSSELNASANGMTQRQSIQDIDSLLSQIDPGIIQDITVIDGPYTSLYGPGFAFITVDLNSPKRYARPEIHAETTFNYDSNGRIFYNRENVFGGGNNWGVVFSYGVRSGSDYHSGGAADWAIPSGFEKWDTMMSLSYDVNAYSRIEFDLLHTEMNNVEMPGIVYDLQNSTNSQYNVRYIVQEDRDGPQQLLVQSWHQETFFFGNAASESKQSTFYQPFIADNAVYEGYERPVNVLSNGYQVATGVRCLRTFGQADNPQWTVGADWRRYEQYYSEADIDAQGAVTYDGEVFGLPESRMDDVGVLTHFLLPLNDRLSFTLGGRVDYASAWVNADDPISWNDYAYPGTSTPDYTLGMSYATVKVALNEHDTLSVGTSYAMRAPNLAELYSCEPYVPICSLGNSYATGDSDLKTERNWQFDVGVSSKRGPFHYGARGFYATIWDYISYIPSCTVASDYSPHYLGRNFSGFAPETRDDLGKQSENGDTVEAEYQSCNLPLVTMAGGDLFGEVELRPGLSVFGCMSYVHAENLHPQHMTIDGEGNWVPAANGGEEPVYGIYPFNGRVSLRVCDPDKKRDKWGTEFVARFVHSQDEVANSLSELRSPGFSVYDIHGYYRLRENIRLTLSLENLLNRYYYEPGSVVMLNSSGIPTRIPEPGFTAMLGLDAKF